MPPFVPYLSVSRSQSVRLGRGPGNQNVAELNSGDTPTNPQTGALIGPFYADLGNNLVRRDVQRHQAIGALVSVGNVSNTVYTDLFAPSGLVVTAGTGFALNVSAGVIQSRYSGAQLAVPATTLTPLAPPLFGNRDDIVVVGPNGAVSLVAGQADLVAPTYEVDALTATGGATGGTINIGFNYNGYWFQATGIGFAATAAAVGTAMLGATGGPNNETLAQFAPGATVTGAGGPLGTAPVTLTAGGGLEGPITNLQATNLLTGGTPVVTFTRTTPGVGASSPSNNGSYLILASVNVPAGAGSSAAYTITTNAKLTS